MIRSLAPAPALALALSLAPAPSAVASEPASHPSSATTAAKQALVEKYGADQRARIDRGVDQVAALWTPADGESIGAR